MTIHAKEGKTEHLRRHFRRPKVSSRDETHILSAAEPLLSAAESPITIPSGAPSASESLVQRRNSTFGGTFGGRMCMTDPKVHLPEAAFGSQSHLHKAFGGRNSLRRPNLSSSRTQFMHQHLSSTLPHIPNMHKTSSRHV
ncbi:hypothetical protein MANES_13G063730v8 [Manihot esculenta]|uniref:Uncharacterized protein n=1 Tax=Manihot esculenta TaxID=3983 RepID=A0ACB7GJK5_MANES|nr:hypothetical protein MANES_13G063730v8 [Manihot esculenta]